MAEKMSIQDYYYQQRRIANAYDISDNQAGCYVTHYPDEQLCGECKYLKSCISIYNEERGSVHG